MSYNPLDLLKGLEKGVIKEYRLTNLIVRRPSGLPTQKRWLILSGKINHVTGTATALYYHPLIKEFEIGSFDKFKILWSELAATANGEFNLFATVAAENRPQWTPIIITCEGMVMISGNALCWLDLVVLEW